MPRDIKRPRSRHGRSMEDEVRHVLRDAAGAEPRVITGLGSRIAGRFKTAGLTKDLSEWRGNGKDVLGGGGQ